MVKVNVKFHPVTCQDGEWRYSSIYSLTWALDGDESMPHLSCYIPSSDPVPVLSPPRGVFEIVLSSGGVLTTSGYDI
jgi:hypothetical protein